MAKKLCAGLLVLLFAGAAHAADHSNLEQDFPTRVEDAYPIAYRAMEFQASGAYEHGGEHGRHAGEFEPEIKWGFMKNAHVALGAPLVFPGDGDMESNGDIALEGLYNFNVETPVFPALAVKTELTFPSGVDSAGVDVEVAAIATRGFGAHRFHLNGIYRHLGAAGAGERSDLFSFGLGYDRPIDLDHLFVADFFIDRSPQAGGAEEFGFNLGVRKQLNPWSVLAVGLGSGFGASRTPDLRATVGAQWSF